jgi:hypothetical protein
MRYVDIPVDRARWRYTVDYQATPDLQVGLEYNPLVEEVGFRGTWILMRETDTRPLIHANTSSDRIGTPKGHQLYAVTAAKTIPGTKLSPYVSFAYSEFERGLIIPFGVNWQPHPQWSLIAMNDGRRPHLLLTHSRERFFVQVAYIWLERPGITVGFGF